jgi:hypothetical protein
VKPARAPQAAPDVPARVKFQVQFSGGPKGKARGSTRASAPEPVEENSLSRLPKVTRLLVLGYRFESLVRAGVVKDYAEIARLTGLSRARVTQITNLTLLPPEIQQAILGLPPIRNGRDLPPERVLRCLSTQPDWKLQRAIWNRLSSNTNFPRPLPSSSGATPSHRPRG